MIEVPVYTVAYTDLGNRVGYDSIYCIFFYITHLKLCPSATNTRFGVRATVNLGPDVTIVVRGAMLYV